MLQALSQLYTLRAIDHNGHITPLGRQMSSFPLEPNLARMLIKARSVCVVSSVLLRPVKERETNSCVI